MRTTLSSQMWLSKPLITIKFNLKVIRSLPQTRYWHKNSQIGRLRENRCAFTNKSKNYNLITFKFKINSMDRHLSKCKTSRRMVAFKWETLTPICFLFSTRLSTKLEVCHRVPRTYFHTPWTHLQSIALLDHHLTWVPKSEALPLALESHQEAHWKWTRTKPSKCSRDRACKEAWHHRLVEEE